ncbi:acetyl-CoA C-acyltransferase family protein [Parvularcula marina]|uniref:Acetyl-CoA C-acyltransferase n=1 Tax=Parvularcula marina TaxID=2292771 RepID=A0A371R808_9PROT|nr:acetyl-CoA C-acyltransferase family protein [Parvularcula marina]RFB01583.1 acetyl-CoA C-acyltransferase [Parvularcula marina]
MAEKAIKDVVVLSAVRTAVGRFGGSLKDVPLEELGGLCVREAISRAGVPAEGIETAVVGNVLRTQSKDAYISRMCAIEGGMSHDSTAVTVNRLCGSGLEAIVQASQQIQLGDAELAVAGGVESMSRTTYSAAAPRFGQKMGPVTMEDDMLAALHDPFGAGHMGMTAENVAEQFSISRETQDEFAEESHRRAINAIEQGYFKEQIVPVELKSRKGTTLFDTDEHPRADVSMEGLSGLRPAFKKDGGTVTAGNASGLNDGAAMLVLASAEKAEELGVKPMARLVGYARAGVDPSIMGTGPIPAVRRVLERTGLSVADLDVIESNEAFAAQACAVSKELDLPAEKVNPNGGAVALGHPVGATGAIVTTKCLYELKRTGGRYGLVTLCIGGGQGIAAIFENLDA